MIKTLKKVILSSLSILGISFLFWILFLLNPSWSYANKTQFDIVSVYHNQPLEVETESVVRNALAIIRTSPLLNEETSLDLCLNDDKVYPHLHPFAGATAYSFSNKTVMYACHPSFNDNTATFKWEVNNYESRTFDLTWLLAHEFTHNLQNQANGFYVLKTTIGKINWKLEGHAEYISRSFKNDQALRRKIENYLIKEKKEHTGIPVFELEDGTKQILSYYKYALVVQYLMEEKGLNFKQLCELEVSLEEAYQEMLEWK